MRRLAAVLLLLPAACGPSESERRAQDQAAVAAVKAAQNRLPPLVPLKPESLLDEDIARVDASGPGCLVRLGEGLAPPVLVTVGSFGWLKLDGAIVKLAGDSGSERGPVDTWTNFTGKIVTLRLGYPGGGAKAGDPAAASRAVTLTLRDPYGRVVYRGAGMQSCSS